jgi:3-deoxy-7-phosphoheptulonate synthase
MHLIHLAYSFYGTGTDGSVSVAVDAMKSASNPHAFMGVTEQGLAAIVKTTGNKDVHVILRGGSKGPNYPPSTSRPSLLSREVPSSVQAKCHDRLLSYVTACTAPVIPADQSGLDGNSLKNHNNQPKVVDSICEQLIAGDRSITGVMIESNINAGRQDVPEDGTFGFPDPSVLVANVLLHIRPLWTQVRCQYH